jgi:hypothetical protein
MKNLFLMYNSMMCVHVGGLPTLTSQTQLLGQPQVASQFFLNHSSASTGSSSPTVPVQQILIPVSTGQLPSHF